MDDGSSDNTWSRIKKLREGYRSIDSSASIRAYQLDGNYGKGYAIKRVKYQNIDIKMNRV